MWQGIRYVRMSLQGWSYGLASVMAGITGYYFVLTLGFYGNSCGTASMHTSSALLPLNAHYYQSGFNTDVQDRVS